MILIVRMVLMELYCIIVLINLFMEQTKRNFLVIISIVFLLFLSIFIRLIYKANILDIEVKKNDKIRLETKQSNNQKNKEILNNNSDNNLAGLIYVCENKDCLLEKFKKCESSQYVIDPKVEYKAYFLVGGLIGNECNILVENNMRSGTLCKIPKNIERNEVLFNNLLKRDFSSIKTYCNDMGNTN